MPLTEQELQGRIVQLENARDEANKIVYEAGLHMGELYLKIDQLKKLNEELAAQNKVLRNNDAVYEEAIVKLQDYQIYLTWLSELIERMHKPEYATFFDEDDQLNGYQLAEMIKNKIKSKQ